MRQFTRFISAVLASVVIFTAAPGHAVGPAGSVRDLGPQVEKMMLTGTRRVSAPFAHVLYCTRQPEDCAVTAPVQFVSMRDEMKDLESVNRRVNSSIEPRADDPRAMGGDIWSLAPKAGDCEDYAITKRHELLKRGWPSGALRLAQVFTPSGEGHLVLVATTSQGDVVLDNLTSRVLPWKQTKLRWRLIQSADDPRIWLQI